MASSSLPAFLATAKEQYLTAVHDGTAAEWVVVMGNEAGDLDSLASSFGYAFFHSIACKTQKVVPLSQTPRNDLHLRAENIHAFELAGFDSDKQLLCIDDVPLTQSNRFPSTQFVLVDHNRLLQRYTENNPSARVVAIVDHHEDEGHHKDTADPRIIAVPTGSCTSLVAKLFKEQCPDSMTPELATLLLSGILIDTSGLKPGGKAELADREAAAFLLPTASQSQNQSLVWVAGAGGSQLELDIVGLTNVLQEKKASISHLSTYDLLRRDYKEYSLTPHWAPSEPILVGLATVPKGLKPWIPEDEEFWMQTEKWMDERCLTVLGILTTFRSKKGKHKRQMLFIIREGEERDELATRLWKGLEDNEELKVKRKKLEKFDSQRKDHDENKMRIYKQRNAHATRKTIAPLVKHIVEQN
ncbi:DHH phosphoesterase [Neolentinus lepideus HHB14362 ss-1]|uniref:DHH phosphoesterase n=1 Tax=Neolentinus lepideus HHB14362 ss-1 TaxID=1314782 RepID=A0A165UII1_9AGAM|nr:DHH phosphoesterase [Neolentinus lepideus HHB14362 ss-1]